MQGRATQIWRKAASWKLQHQDEKIREETRTTDDEEKLEPAIAETPRTHHSRWRMSGKARRQRRGKGWTAWTGLKDTDCRAVREEKSKSVAERLRETAEKTVTAEDEAGTGL